MSGVILSGRFNPAALCFSAPHKNKKGGQCVNVYLDGENGAKKRVLIQTPPLTVPFDVSPNKDANDIIQSYSVNLSFRGADADPRVSEFLACMRQLDEVLLAAAVANSKEWFGKATSRDVIKEFHSKIVRDPKQTQYSPTMKVKVPLKEPGGDCVTQIYGENRQPEDISYIKKGSVVRMILELIPVWFINKNMFGVSWRAVQIKVDERPGLNDYAFAEDAAVAAPVADVVCEGESLLG